ncbi:hypothetical protein HDU87_004694 [Geranomyces variabilis]|uniref:Inner centromere protein ARK-binding domain-containing protein n=1 Tax=Geranomyces variabilis TaxID=109894 RepID=A0AAD5TNA2_9FUNG|nr:hypothetical protein HDU87_004694 [Geranomyces variabilis]
MAPPLEPPIESPIRERISLVPETPGIENVIPVVSPPKSKPTTTLPSAIPVYNTVVAKQPVLKLPPIIKRDADGPLKRKLEEIKRTKPATTRGPPPRRPPIVAPKPVKLVVKPPPRPEEIMTIADENGNLPEPDSDPSICSDESDNDDFGDDASFDARGDWIENTPERPRKTRRFKEPGWVATPELRKAIVMQERTDPDSVFGSARPALEDVFREGMTRKPTRAARDTEFTGEDCLTEAEIAAYNANMKYTA